MERQSLDHSAFGPFYDENSRVLILGSFPSPKSRAAGFYYGHPQNRFWPLLALLFGEERPQSTEEKKALLRRHGVALYDVVESCSIVGASDSSIAEVKVTDLAPILRVSQIGGRIFTNGARAHALYMKYTCPVIGVPARRLPSTSPANAACSLEKLARDWGEALKGACL